MAFEKKWRERRIVHRTPGGKLTRVKISSLPADEQQKYNPNRYKRLGVDTKMSEEDYAELQKREVDAGHIFDFYIQVDDPSELDDIEDGALLLATTDGTKVDELFDNKDMTIMKIKNVPMDAVKKVISPSENGEEPDLESLENVKFEDLGDLEGTERYEKIKFSDEPVYQIDIASYLEYVDVSIDEPMDDDDVNIKESFYNYYYKGE